MSYNPVLRILPQWDSDVEYYMEDSLQGYSKEFEKEVNSGKAQLWEVDNGDTYFITRTERDDHNRKILVVCCYEGREIRRTYKLIEKSCIKLGFAGVRFHTRKKGMERLAKWHGFELLDDRGFEKVFIKWLHH